MISSGTGMLLENILLLPAERADPSRFFDRRATSTGVHLRGYSLAKLVSA